MDELGNWREQGRAAARARLRDLDPGRPLVPQACELIADVARDMGHRVQVRPWGIADVACPWGEAKRAGLEPHCGARCEAWMLGCLEEIDSAFGTRLRMRTVQSIPDGESTCAREVWEER
ncbi:MAG: hypothetical protein ACOZNI_09285 [Myxococcota bacterium]